MASITTVVRRWATAALLRLNRVRAPRRDLILYRNNDTLKGIVTFQLGLRTLRFEFESPWLYVNGHSDGEVARVTSFYLVERERYAFPEVANAWFVGLDRVYWVEATDPYDRVGSLEEAFAELLAALRANSPAALLEERMAPDSTLKVASAEFLAAEALLAQAEKSRGYSELGDGEITWQDPETSQQVASGNFGHGGFDVDVYFPEATRPVRFEGEQAARLHDLGVLVSEGQL